MAEYIKRNYLRKMAMFETAYTMETETDTAIVLRMIDDAPTADVAPVVHGKWITRSDKGVISMTHPYMCSRCWRGNKGPRYTAVCEDVLGFV
jgi:hypothetical protein